MSIQVDLGEEWEARVQSLVAGGSYPSKDDVLRRGVELLVQHDAFQARLHASMEAAERDLAEGRLVDADEAFDEMDAAIDAAFRKDAAAA